MTASHKFCSGRHLWKSTLLFKRHFPTRWESQTWIFQSEKQRKTEASVYHDTDSDEWKCFCFLYFCAELTIRTLGRCMWCTFENVCSPSACRPPVTGMLSFTSIINAVTALIFSSVSLFELQEDISLYPVHICLCTYQPLKVWGQFVGTQPTDFIAEVTMETGDLTLAASGFLTGRSPL